VRYKTGVRCGMCESAEIGVVLTRHGNRHTMRTRKCKKCGHRFRTIEINERYITSDAKFDFLFRTPEGGKKSHDAAGARPSRVSTSQRDDAERDI
jgi:hypothetical protein